MTRKIYYFEDGSLRPKTKDVVEFFTAEKFTITVGLGGDFPNLKTAFSFLSSLKTELNSDGVEVRILAGTVITEPLVVRGGGLQLRHYNL